VQGGGVQHLKPVTNLWERRDGKGQTTTEKKQETEGVRTPWREKPFKVTTCHGTKGQRVAELLAGLQPSGGGDPEQRKGPPGYGGGGKSARTPFGSWDGPQRKNVVGARKKKPQVYTTETRDIDGQEKKN